MLDDAGPSLQRAGNELRIIHRAEPTVENQIAAVCSERAAVRAVLTCTDAPSSSI